MAGSIYWTMHELYYYNYYLNIYYLNSLQVYIKKSKVFYFQKLHSGESTTRMWGKLSTTCSNLLKYPNGELEVAVDHNQLRTMASETVDRIAWSHPHSWQYTLCSSCIVWIGAARSQPCSICNLETFCMRGNHHAYAAPQCIIIIIITTIIILA